MSKNFPSLALALFSYKIGIIINQGDRMKALSYGLVILGMLSFTSCSHLGMGKSCCAKSEMKKDCKDGKCDRSKKQCDRSAKKSCCDKKKEDKKS